MEGKEILEQVLPYMGGLATAGGAFGSWYLRFRQENTNRQKYKLDYRRSTLEQNVQLQTTELEYLAKARQELTDWFEKRLAAADQELAWAREANKKQTEQLSFFQQQVEELESEVSKYKAERDRILQQFQAQIKELEAKPQQLAEALKQSKELGEHLQSELLFCRQRLKETEVKSRRYQVNSQEVIRHLHEKIRQLRTPPD